MRLNPDQELTAAYIVNTYTEAELARLIKVYGEERYSRQIARRIVQERPIRTTLELSRVIEQAVKTRSKIHPATRTFQAIRIAVNQELEHLELALKQAVDLLGFQGRLVVISYHSLEDRAVKQHIRAEVRGCICEPKAPACTCGRKPRLRRITRRPVGASEDEVARNPRARSARLRAAERLAEAA